MIRIAQLGCENISLKMKRKYFILIRLNVLIIASLLSSVLLGQDRNVLFVGNSLTYANDMPKTLQHMFDEASVGIKVYQSCYPGMPLSDHLGIRFSKPYNSQSIQILKTKSWYRVVLQEGTVRVLIPEARDKLFIRAVYALDSIILTRGGKTILYQNYVLGSYPRHYCYPSHLIDSNLSSETYCSDEFLNSPQELEQINDAIYSISKEKKLEVASVGEAFETCKRKYPQLGLIVGNGDTHPSEIGSYLIACVFYGRLAMKKSSDVKFYDGLDLEVAKKIQKLADEVNGL